MKERIKWMDIMKGICMLFVILSHTGYISRWMWCIYTPFFLSGFFFVSGYFFFGNWVYNNRLQKLVNIFTSILLPYLVYWVLSFSVEQILKKNFFFFPELVDNIIKGNKLWFVSCLLVCELITWLFLVVIKGKKIFLYFFPFINLIIYVLWPKSDSPLIWYVNISFLANVYLGIGMITKLHYWDLIRYLNRSVGIVLLILVGLIIMSDMIFCLNEGSFNKYFSNFPFFFIESLFCIFALIYVCKNIICKNCYLEYIGINSLLYYFFANQALNITRKVGSLLGIDSPNILYALISVLFVSIFLVIPIYLVNKYIPVMSGKWRIKLKMKS